MPPGQPRTVRRCRYRTAQVVFRDVLVTLGASGRVNVGPDDVQQVLIAAWSRVEPHRQHSQPFEAGHVRAFVCASRSLDYQRLHDPGKFPLPYGTQHRIEVVPPAALLVLQVLDTTQQQEEACGGAGAERHHTASGLQERCRIKG